MTYKDRERISNHVILSEVEGSRRSRIIIIFCASLDSSASLGMTYKDRERISNHVILSEANHENGCIKK